MHIHSTNNRTYIAEIWSLRSFNPSFDSLGNQHHILLYDDKWIAWYQIRVLHSFSLCLHNHSYIMIIWWCSGTLWALVLCIYCSLESQSLYSNCYRGLTLRWSHYNSQRQAGPSVWKQENCVFCLTKLSQRLGCQYMLTKLVDQGTLLFSVLHTLLQQRRCSNNPHRE